MTRKKRRMIVVLACGLGLGTATVLTLSAFSSDMVFFVAPSEVATKAPRNGRTFRMGGLVEAGSLVRATTDGKPSAHFRVGDGGGSVEVTYVGILPDLFRDNQSVIATGHMDNAHFVATEVLAKHDETYMPKELKDAMAKAHKDKPMQEGSDAGGSP